MNVVGKVGSLITQGVYSVATPFHPFGGAVDVIVVQQKDGSFRSTPWYVRFGKFQGVLSAEKMVLVDVNGVKANFVMYLDNSGEAYFVREVNEEKQKESSGVIDANSEPVKTISNGGSFVETRRLEHSISDPGIIQLQVASDPSAAVRVGRASDAVGIERQESGRRYYEFEDEPTFLEGSSELSEYAAIQYGSLESNEVVDSKDSDSEVVLLSVDGHVLTAPVSASDHNTECVELGTPQFHLGPAESPWDDDYLRNLDASTANDLLDRSCKAKGNDNASRYQQEVCQREKEHSSPLQENQSLEKTQNEAKDLMHSDSEDVFNRKEVFKSCLALTELENNLRNFDLGDEISSPKGQNSREESSTSCEIPGANQHDNLMQLRKTIPIDSNSPDGNRCPDSIFAVQEDDQNNLQASDMDSFRRLATDDLEFNIDHSAESSSVEVVDSTQEVHAPEDDCCESELTEPEKVTSNEGGVDNSTSSLKLSLCGNEPKAGMDLVAAAEAFEEHRISEEDVRPESQNEDSKISPAPAGRRWTLWPIPFRRVKTVEHTSINSLNEEVFVHSESAVQNTHSEPTISSTANQVPPQKQFVRTNVLTNEDVASLNLKEGQNSVTFSFSTRVLGTQQVHAHIYLWKWNAKIVISDVDGTITKSDVLGQFMPLVGKDWSQSGVAKLFSAIRENGYQLLFLSARAIVQAYLTKSFLFNLKQDGKTLPTGPVVISPDGLFPSLFREVIRRAPHEFKIACLEDIRKLFPPDYNPFYAGFGNRDTDELSYRKMGIPKGKIFIINPKGEVAVSHRIDRAKSYTSLHTLVNDMFPPTCWLVEHEDYNSWNYWKLPLPDID